MHLILCSISKYSLYAFNFCADSANLIHCVTPRNFTKEFRTAKKAKLPEETHYWIDDLMRGCLAALNNNKEIVITIEQNDNLKNLISASCLFYADLKKDIFDMLIEKHMPGNNLMIWVNQDGKLVAINACWKINLDDQWITREAQNIHKWKQDSIFVTSKTDAIVLKINPLTRTFDIVMQGRIAEEISSDQLFTILQRNLSTLKQSNTDKCDADQAGSDKPAKQVIIHATKQANDFEKEYN